jgi:AcrR family transcriptional regulator
LSAENRPESPRGAGFEAMLERILAAVGRARTALWRHFTGNALTLATVAALVGAALLVLSDFLDVVRFVDISGRLIPGAEATREGTAAMVVIGVAAGLAALLARWAEHPLPAIACAALGAIALAIVLIADLPDVTSEGLTGGKQIGEADPGPGFWVELAGAVTTLAAGLLLARLLAVARAIGRPSPSGGTDLR